MLCSLYVILVDYILLKGMKKLKIYFIMTVKLKFNGSGRKIMKVGCLNFELMPTYTKFLIFIRITIATLFI